VQHELTDKITSKLLVKLAKTVLIDDFAEAFLMLARRREPEFAYERRCEVLSDLTSWTIPSIVRATTVSRFRFPIQAGFCQVGT